MLSRDARVRRSTEGVGRRGREGSETGGKEGLDFLREGGLERSGLVIVGFLGRTEGQYVGDDVVVLIGKKEDMVPRLGRLGGFLDEGVTEGRFLGNVGAGGTTGSVDTLGRGRLEETDGTVGSANGDRPVHRQQGHVTKRKGSSPL